jgi:hypothetical protein
VRRKQTGGPPKLVIQEPLPCQERKAAVREAVAGKLMAPGGDVVEHAGPLGAQVAYYEEGGSRSYGIEEIQVFRCQVGRAVVERESHATRA